MISIKNEKEIEIMRQGGNYLAQVMKEAIAFSKPGVVLCQINDLIEKLIQSKKAKPSFKMVKDYYWASCLNINQGVVHGIPGNYSLKENDYLSLDMGLFFQGFHTDMSRTIKVTSKKNQETEDKFLITGKQALVEAIKAVKPGNQVGHISLAIEKTLKKAGYSPIEVLTGHGIGHNLHEDPPIPCFLAEEIEETPLLKKGMTLALEVIYAKGKPDLVMREDDWTLETEDGQLSGLFEDTVAIGDKGALILTQ